MAEELKQQLQQASADAQSNSAPGRKTEKTEAA
jgi:hypothetical protein